MLRMRCSSDRLCSSCGATIHSGDDYYIGRSGNWSCLECGRITPDSPSRKDITPEQKAPKLTPEQKAIKLLAELCSEYGLSLKVTTEFVRAYDNVVDFKVAKYDMYLTFREVSNCVHLNSRLTPYVDRRGTKPAMPLADKLYSAIKFHLSESGARHIRIGQTGGGNAYEVREYLLSKVKAS